jgi:hypothetical protein
MKMYGAIFGKLEDNIMNCLGGECRLAVTYNECK